MGEDKWGVNIITKRQTITRDLDPVLQDRESKPDVYVEKQVQDLDDHKMKTRSDSKHHSPSFFTIFLFLLSFLRASMSMCGSSAAFASSQCCWSPRMHTENLGLGVVFSLQGRFIKVQTYGTPVTLTNHIESSPSGRARMDDF